MRPPSSREVLNELLKGGVRVALLIDSVQHFLQRLFVKLGLFGFLADYFLFVLFVKRVFPYRICYKLRFHILIVHFLSAFKNLLDDCF